MRQLCPYCAKLVDLPDDTAGKETPCPACAKPFAVPKAYTPSVNDERPAPPPGFVPPMPANAPAAMPMPVVTGDTRECGFTISHGPASWIPVLSLTVTLVSVLFFSWVGSFPGGYRAFSQSPLQSLFATFSGNTLKSLEDAEKGIETNIRTNWLMLPFLASLIAATALAWLERFFPKPKVETVPAFLGWLVKFWPHRFLTLFTLTTLALVLILWQSWRGFGLETAIRDSANQKFAKAMEEADSSHKKQELSIGIGQEIGKYCLSDTNASVIGISALCLALESLCVYWWLDRRGSKPEPRVIMKY